MNDAGLPVEVFTGAGSDTRSRQPADVEVMASASARELCASKRPRTSLEVDGDLEREDASRRANLPPRLEPGTVYREVAVHRRLDGRLQTPREL